MNKYNIKKFAGTMKEYGLILFKVSLIYAGIVAENIADKIAIFLFWTILEVIRYITKINVEAKKLFIIFIIIILGKKRVKKANK